MLSTNIKRNKNFNDMFKKLLSATFFFIKKSPIHIFYYKFH